MTTPFDFDIKGLTAVDFHRHELQFRQIVAELFACKDVNFFLLSDSGELKEDDNLAEFPETIRAGATLAIQQKLPIIDPKRSNAFLPISEHGKMTAIAQISGGSPTLYTHPAAWFTLRGRQAKRELRLIKQWSRDPASGMLNATHLQQELRLLTRLFAEAKPDEYQPHLLLIEVFNRSRDASQALANIRETGFYLNSLFGDSTPIHHLGSGVFGLIWNKTDEQEAQKLGYAILRKLKRYNAAKAHIGLAPLIRTQDQASDESIAEPIVEAWQALKAARQRGVFALCSTTALNAKHHELPLLSPTILTSFKKKWRRDNQFAIIICRRDMDIQQDFQSCLNSLVGENATIITIDHNNFFIYLPGEDEEEALKRAKVLRDKINKLGGGTYSQGIANYPCPGFKKADIPLNAQKALHHASFYGKAAITSFDAVSLNISGDIYYNEGDLNSAIREYRLGLNLDPQNINLLNSLGVIYAQIERYKMAIPLFERILGISPADFMAMYNLGFAYLRLGDNDQALKYFEQATALNDNVFDLLLQLGQIYCTKGQYKKAVNILKKAEKAVSAPKTGEVSQPWEHCEPWHESGNKLGHDLIYRYLGEAYKGINNNKEAITYLQRATRHNKRDAQALSLLGELYAIEKEGIDIAISLCQQAVELDNESAGHWYRLAFTLLKSDDAEAALRVAKKSLALAPKEQNTLLLLAQIYKKMGKFSLARATLERLLKLDGTNKKASKLLKLINKNSL